MKMAAVGMFVLIVLAALAAAGCLKKRERLPATPYPKAKLAYRVNNCIYMDLNHAGEPEKGVCYGVAGEPMMAADFDGNGTTDLALRRAGVLYIDTKNDGDSHESMVDLGWVGDANAFVAADFSGTASHRGPASLCVIRGDRGRIQGLPAGAPPPAQPERRVFPGEELFAGRWDPEGPARLGARIGRCVDLDDTGDDRPDKHICYEDLASIDQVLVGDWNGDGRDDLILRRDGCVFVDTRLDGTHTETQCMASQRGAAEYFAGSWDGK
jgi:hypothetical protein